MKLYCPNCCASFESKTFDTHIDCSCGIAFNTDEAQARSQHSIMEKAIMLWKAADCPEEHLNKYLTGAETSFDREMEKKAKDNFFNSSETLFSQLNDIIVMVQNGTKGKQINKKISEFTSCMDSFVDKLTELSFEPMKWDKDEDENFLAELQNMQQEVKPIIKKCSIVTDSISSLYD